MERAPRRFTMDLRTTNANSSSIKPKEVEGIPTDSEGLLMAEVCDACILVISAFTKKKRYTSNEDIITELMGLLFEALTTGLHSISFHIYLSS